MINYFKLRIDRVSYESIRLEQIFMYQVLLWIANSHIIDSLNSSLAIANIIVEQMHVYQVSPCKEIDITYSSYMIYYM